MMEATMETSSRMLKDWCPRKTRQCMPGRLQCMPSHTCSSATGIVRNTVSASRMPLRIARGTRGVKHACWVALTCEESATGQLMLSDEGTIDHSHIIGSWTRQPPP